MVGWRNLLLSYYTLLLLTFDVNASEYSRLHKDGKEWEQKKLQYTVQQDAAV
jgi:hypothetical protein